MSALSANYRVLLLEDRLDDAADKIAELEAALEEEARLHAAVRLEVVALEQEIAQMRKRLGDG